MKYIVSISKAAERKIKKLDTQTKKKLSNIFIVLESDPFDTGLKTHKLKGELKGYYSCRLDYFNRIIFIIIEQNSIIIIDIGSHDDVY